MNDEEITTCDNCGAEFEDDGDVFECRKCRVEVCVDCEESHVMDGDCEKERMAVNGK